MNRVNFDWYQALYKTGDERLIKYFWYWYNHHKVKSKNKAARCVLIHYYSTNACPRWLENMLCFKKLKTALAYNYYAV